jgi:hypothetical protein
MNQLALPTRKPRNDSVLKQLPVEKQREIAEFARKHSLVRTSEWLAAQGINTSKSSLGDFLSWFRPFEQNEAGCWRSWPTCRPGTLTGRPRNCGRWEAPILPPARSSKICVTLPFLRPPKQGIVSPVRASIVKLETFPCRQK